MRRTVAVAALAVLLGACTTDGAGQATPSPTAVASPSAPEVVGPTTSESPAATGSVLLPSGRSDDETAADVRARLADAVDGLADTTVPEWVAVARDGVAGDWPIVLGEAVVTADGNVDADLTVVGDLGADWDLRVLAAAPALGDVGLSLTATVDAAPVEVVVDDVGARADVVTAPGDGLATLDLSYRVPDRSGVTDDGSPAGFGLLARSAGVVALGHWLPVPMLATDAGPMQSRGDVGGFPAAAWSVVVHHDGTFVSGGLDGPCPAAVEPRPDLSCTWSRGLGLRDLSAVLLADASSSVAEGVRVVAPSGALSDAQQAQAVEEAAAYLALLDERLGVLPWTTVDVVAVPILPGAAGMEFPGMVWIDPDVWPADDAQLGSYVLAHEVGHQWFHAVVGNGSLSAPVVDEATAQYVSYLLFADRFGEDAAAALDARSITGRGARAVADGIPDETPALALDEFTSSRSYGAAVYGRGGAAWIEAERAAGRDAVVAVLRALVAAHGLGEADVSDVLAVAARVDATVADVLADGWGVATPAG